MLAKVMTDYPDRELVENMKINVAENMPDSLRGRISVKVSACHAVPSCMD